MTTDEAQVELDLTIDWTVRESARARMRMPSIGF